MAIDSVTLSLSGMSSPVMNDRVATLTASAATFLAGVATGATRVEFDLLYSPVTTGAGQNAVKQVISTTNDTTATSTNQYSVTFAAALFANAGLYQVRAKAVVGSGSPEIISNFVTALSSEILVTEAKAQTLDDVKTQLNGPSTTVWKKRTFTGAQLKAATGANTGTSKNVLVANLPSNAVLVGGSINVTTADTGGSTTTTATLGADSTAYTELLAATSLRSAAETGVSASFVPNLAGGTDLYTALAVTGSSITIADIADATTFTLSWGYVVPNNIG